MPGFIVLPILTTITTPSLHLQTFIIIIIIITVINIIITTSTTIFTTQIYQSSHAMDPIIEEDEPLETPPLSPTEPQPQTPPSRSISNEASSSNSSTDSNASLDAIKERRQRLFDIYTFTPTQQIPRDVYRLTDQPPVVLWPPKEPVQCNYVLCSPEINEQYTTSINQIRPNFPTRAEPKPGVKLDPEFPRFLPKRDIRPTGPLRSVSLKLTEPPKSSSSSTAENESTRSASPVLETSRQPSSRKPSFRSNSIPIENIPQKRVSLIPAGLKVLPKWGGQTEALPKPYENRMCNGCDRYITLTKTQYVCNDIGCANRLCDRCYNIWLDAKWEGRGIVTPEKLRMAHTAAEIRERYVKGMLQDQNTSLRDKTKYIGEAAAVAVGHTFTDPSYQSHKIGHKTDPFRYRNLDLNPLKEVFGKEEVEMTLLDSSTTKESSLNPKVGLDEPHHMIDLDFDEDILWGWDYAINKRDAAATGRTAPALPQLDYQPPTHAHATPTPSHHSSMRTTSSSSLTVISSSETVVGRADVDSIHNNHSQRSSSPSWTIWTLGSSGSISERFI
ncbi:hypothetical protein TWF106_004017 [Orbilia oligospora]|nr:hypothetical protein TWF106_004017 [Orbilia oligospora]KAF3223819.1 hypothetical protein TWF679_000254 [Orbilia oligospora]